MSIGTNDNIPKFGTQDQVDSSAGTIATDVFSVVGDIVQWVNDDDAPYASCVLKCQFDITMPTVGRIDLYCRPMNIESANDPGAPDTSYEVQFLGTFQIDFGVANDVDFYAFIPMVTLPNFQSSQPYEFYLKNVGAAQTIGTGWNLWITPWTFGPKA